MLFLILFIPTAAVMKLSSINHSGYIAGYGIYNGMVPGPVAGISILIVTVGICLDILHSKKLRNYSSSLIIGLLIRVFLVFFDRYGQRIFQLPNSGFDSNVYYRHAALYASTGDAGRGGFFSTIMGLLFRITGVSQLYGQFIISLFALVALIMLCKLLDEICDNNKVKSNVIAILAVLPNYAILSSIFLRESIVSMLLAISSYCFILWMKRRGEIFFYAAFILVIISSAFHSGSISVGIAYVVIRFLYNKKEEKYQLSVRNLPITMILTLFVFYLYLNYGQVLFNKMNNISSIASVGNTYSEGGSSYAAFVGNSNSVFNMIIYSLPRLLYFLFSPFPWQWRGIADIIAFMFSSLFYMISICKGLLALRTIDREKKKYLLSFIIIGLCTAFVFSWGTTNTGTATRHRDKMIIIYGVILALGIQGRQKKRKKS